MPEYPKTFIGQLTGRNNSYDQLVKPASPVVDSPIRKVADVAGEAQMRVGVGGVDVIPKGFSWVWWGAVLVMLLAFMWFASWLGKGEGFGDIRGSAYNALVISLWSILGIIFWKAVFSMVKVPIISPLVQSV